MSSWLARAGADEGIHTSIEPGTLPRGGVALETGVGIGAGSPVGFGGRLVVGVGGVDVFAGASYVPGLCFWGRCTDGNLVLGGGVQARLFRSADGLTDVGARLSLDGIVVGSSEGGTLFAGSVQLATGTKVHRLLVDAVGLYDSVEAIVGARVGYAVLGNGLSLMVSAGPGVDTSGHLYALFALYAAWR